MMDVHHPVRWVLPGINISSFTMNLKGSLMRITTKIMAAAAIAVLSASSFATDWTGSLANVKMTFNPNNSGAGISALSVTGTGSSCD